MSDEQVWLTAEQAAHRAACSVKTITKAARALQLRGYRLAHRRSWRFLAEDIDRWMRASATPQLVTRVS